MKIASLVCAYPPYAGGMGNSAKQINELLDKQHEITIFTPSLVKALFRYGHGAFFPQLLWHLKNFDYIYLHYPFFGTAEIVWLFKIFHKKPKLIVHYHMDVKGLKPLAKILSLPSRLIAKSLLNQAETIVCASLDYIKASSIKNYYLKHKEKFQEIPFGIDVYKFQPKFIYRKQKNKNLAKAQAIIRYVNDKLIKRDINLLFVGGLDQAHYFKGVEVLLEALFLTTKRNWKLKIVGEGNRRWIYEKKAAELKLDKQIEFTGRLEEKELIRAFQNADLFILPSINNNEAFGIVLIEALSCGVPVIASNLPGVRRVFTPNEEGLLVEPRNSHDLRKKIDFILNHEDIRQKMAAAAREVAEKKYDLKKMEDKLNKLFK